MARVRARRIHRPQIVAARTEGVGWSLIALFVLLPWLLAVGSPWLGQIPLPNWPRVVSPLERQAGALRQQLWLVRQQNQALMAEIAQMELDLRIDRRANGFAAEQIAGLRREREQLSQEVADWQQRIGANTLPDLIHDIQVKPEDGRRFGYALELAPEYQDSLAAGAQLALWVSGRWREQFVKAALGDLARDRIRVPMDQTRALAFEGTFVLPEGFSPESLIIELLPVAGLVSGPRQELAWDAAADQ